jgi:hypothetical protein
VNEHTSASIGQSASRPDIYGAAQSQSDGSALNIALTSESFLVGILFGDHALTSEVRIQLVEVDSKPEVDRFGRWQVEQKVKEPAPSIRATLEGAHRVRRVDSFRWC